MSSTNSICLIFASQISEPIKSGISYTFRVFAAIYNYRVVDSDQPAIRFAYGLAEQQSSAAKTFSVPRRYKVRSPSESIPKLTQHRYAVGTVCVFHGVDAATGNPDSLGEIFEWLSSSHEISLQVRNSVGRIPYSEMISPGEIFRRASRTPPSYVLNVKLYSPAPWSVIKQPAYCKESCELHRVSTSKLRRRCRALRRI